MFVFIDFLSESKPVLPTEYELDQLFYCLLGHTTMTTFMGLVLTF
jgi:hypothetical protein